MNLLNGAPVALAPLLLLPLAMGRWSGEILTAPSGDGGFGYDPLMHIPTLGQTVAALSAEVKNRHSHRALAAAQLITQFREVWRLG